MDIRIRIIEKNKPELIDVQCHEENDTVREIVAFVKSRQGRLTGIMNGNQYEVPMQDILYIESVDDRTFLYTDSHEYEIRQRIYELENDLAGRHFLRISKSTIVNLMKIQSIRPALNGRFTAILSNNEEVIISRKYVADLKKILKGDKGE